MGESGQGSEGCWGPRGAAGRRAQALERGDLGAPNAPGKESRAARVCSGSRLPSECSGSPSVQNQLFGQLQAAVGLQQAVGSAASIAPRAGGAERSVTARPAWLPGLGSRVSGRESAVLASLVQPRPANSLPALRSNVGDRRVWTLAGRGAAGCTRLRVHPLGRGQWLHQGAGPGGSLCQAQAPALGPPVQPGVGLLRLTPGRREGGGNGQCAPWVAE